MWTSKILPLIIILLAAGIASGCTADSSGDPESPEDAHIVRLKIEVVLDNSLSTRATPTPGDYDPGTIYENYIDIENRDFRVLFFNKNNKYIGTFKPKKFTHDTDIRKKYSIEGDVDNKMLEDCGNTLKVVLLANWKIYPVLTVGETRIEDLASISSYDFDIDNDIMVDLTHHIPMIGILDTQELKFEKNGDILTCDLGMIHMLRAFAKIEVRLGNSSVKTFDGDPVMTLVNTGGYKFPLNVTEESHYKKDNFNDDYTSEPSIPENTTSAENITMPKTSENSDSWVLYVPEFKNIVKKGDALEDDKRARIKVRFKDIDQDYYIDFKTYPTPTSYEEGDHFDLLRNNWYIFEVSKKDYELNITVDVIPFTAVELNPDYGLKREEYTGYIIGKDKENRDCWYDGNYYNPENAIPLYLGPKDNHGNFVTINGKEYLLVYADYERTAANLDHFIEKETRKKYFLYPAARTGYENVNWTFYLNDMGQRVWLSEDYNEWKEGEKWVEEQKKNVEAWFWQEGTTWYRTLNEWDRLDYNKAIWDSTPRVYPKYWFDVLGNRYPYSQGDTKQKRADIIKGWVKYLEDPATNNE